MKKEKKCCVLNSQILAVVFIVAALAGAGTYCAVTKTRDPDAIPGVYVQNGKMNREILDESLELGTQFLLNNQKEEGNFNYEYNFLTQTFTEGDNQVRQAGALWGVSLIHNDNPSEETREAIIRGLDFFDSISKVTEDGAKFIVYPGDSQGSTGTIALIVLSHIELLSADEDLENREKYEKDLDMYLQFLLKMRKSDGQFFSRFRHQDGIGFSKPSPYFDGESLLALTKAAKYVGYEELEDLIKESAEAMYQENVVKALELDPDSDTTKGFYQWGSMSFYELYTSDFSNVERYAERTIELAKWMIDIHKTLERTRNTAYAYEGMISAWELARLTNDVKAMEKIALVIDEGLYKLTSWQVGHSIENNFLMKHKINDPLAVGGIMNKKDEPTLRIDVTQHQMHVVILARRFVYK